MDGIGSLKAYEEACFQWIVLLTTCCTTKQLIIGILILDVAYKGARCLVPTLEMLACHSHHFRASLLLYNRDVLLCHIPYSTVIDPMMRLVMIQQSEMHNLQHMIEALVLTS